MKHRPVKNSTTEPDEGSLELNEDVVRARAYWLYEDRGCEDGHDLEDWLRAESEVFGRKPATHAEAEDTEGGSRAA